MRTRSLFLVHAHPDDESILTGGAIMRARAAGHRVVVAMCTGGEEGEIHTLGEAVRPRLAEVRASELRAACAILGVDRLEPLGYRDSGMAGTPANERPGCFHQASLDEAAGRLAVLLREERPDVVVVYTPDGTYGHPDHVRAHEATMAALVRLARESWEPERVFWHAVPRSAATRLRTRLGSRAHDAMAGVGVPDHQITTELDVRDLTHRRLAAVAAHVSQNPADLGTAMTGQVLDAMGGFEHYVHVGGSAPGRPRRDLFEGLAGRETVAAGPKAGRPEVPTDGM